MAGTQELRDDRGRLYYYNPETQESRWTKPVDLTDGSDHQRAAAEALAKKAREEQEKQAQHFRAAAPAPAPAQAQEGAGYTGAPAAEPQQPRAPYGSPAPATAAYGGGEAAGGYGAA